MDDPLVGRIVAGRYRVEGRLGAGAMGAVYRARHATTGGELALKFLHGQVADDDAVVKRFTLEARNAARIQHPGTVRVIDFGNDRGLLFLALELVRGETLAEVIAREAPLPWRRAADVARQVLDALAAAHEDAQRIVHRDVKPGNVMLVALPGAGPGDVVKLLDFGVSRALAGTGAGTAGVIGTPYYIAPELWRGEAADARTDLYAVGAVLYEMLTGRPPFEPATPGGPVGPAATSTAGAMVALMRLHLDAPRPDPRALAPGTPEPIARLVRDLLAVDRDDRPRDARAAIARLDAALAPPRASRRRVALLAVGGLAALAALAVAVALVTRGGGSAPARVELEQCVPPAARSIPDTQHAGFVTRLGDADHLAADGSRLRSAGRVLARDRERVHAGLGDPDDALDDRMGDPAVRLVIADAIDGTMATTIQRAILDGTPRVRVDFYLPRQAGAPGGMCLELLPD
ncbi:MAG: serine/threonine protein kinase [Deltaproteobacteria bacterium]|nr:serine/threonine protein kinase [Deltaproteobacteria bacterium]